MGKKETVSKNVCEKHRDFLLSEHEKAKVITLTKDTAPVLGTVKCSYCGHNALYNVAFVQEKGD